MCLEALQLQQYHILTVGNFFYKFVNIQFKFHFQCYHLCFFTSFLSLVTNYHFRFFRSIIYVLSWMASLTWWTWVWVNSRSWWWTGRPGVLWFMGLQRVGHDWVTELNWTEPNHSGIKWEHNCILAYLCMNQELHSDQSPAEFARRVVADLWS